MSWITKILLGVDTTEFRKGLGNADAALKKFSGQLKNLGGLIGATFIGSQITAFTKKAIELGSQMKTVGQGFERMADQKTLQGLRSATRGLVSDIELMKVSVQAGNFGIPIEQMGTLLDFAARRAAETGQEVDYLVNSIVTGIGRKSPMILDNLGISTTRLKQEFHGAAIEAQSIADVAAAVGKIADVELGKMGPPIETAADQMARLGVHFDNFLAKISKPIEITFEFVFGGLADFMDVRTSENVNPFDRLMYLLSYGMGQQGQITRAGIYGQAMAGASPFEGMSPSTGLPGGRQVFPYTAQEMGSGIFDQFPGFDTASLNGLREYQKYLTDLFNAARVGTPEFTNLKNQIAALDQKIKDITDGVVPQTAALKLQAKTTNDVYQAQEKSLMIMKQIPATGNAYTDYINRITEAYTALENELNAMNYLGEQFGEIFRSAFDAALEGSGNFFDTVKEGFKNYVKQILAMTAATTALAVAIAFVTGGANFKAAFNAVGGAMGTPFGFSEGGQFGLKGRDFFFGFKRNQSDIMRNGG